MRGRFTVTDFGDARDRGVMDAGGSVIPAALAAAEARGQRLSQAAAVVRGFGLFVRLALGAG